MEESEALLFIALLKDLGQILDIKFCIEFNIFSGIYFFNTMGLSGFSMLLYADLVST